MNIDEHLKRMEESKTIGYIIEWHDFKKKIRKLQESRALWKKKYDNLNNLKKLISREVYRMKECRICKNQRELNRKIFMLPICDECASEDWQTVDDMGKFLFKHKSCVGVYMKKELYGVQMPYPDLKMASGVLVISDRDEIIADKSKGMFLWKKRTLVEFENKHVDFDKSKALEMANKGLKEFIIARNLGITIVHLRKFYRNNGVVLAEVINDTTYFERKNIDNKKYSAARDLHALANNLLNNLVIS